AGIVDVLPAIAAFVAHPPLVHMWIFAGLEAIDAVLILFDLNRATGGAVGADVIVAAHEPDALLVEKIFVAQGANGTQIDDVAGELVGERKLDLAGIVAEDVDLFVRAPIDDHQLTGSADLAREADAATAHHAAIDEQRHRVAQAAAAA